MLLTDDIALRPAPARAGLPQCEVVIAGRATGLRVPGQVFEAAVKVDDRYLVFATEGVTMEELLSIHLVSADGRLLDTASVGLMSALGVFAGLKLEAPATARFRFLGELAWSVEVYPAPRWTWPLRREGPGVKRPWRLRRAFRVRASEPA